MGQGIGVLDRRFGIETNGAGTCVSINPTSGKVDMPKGASSVSLELVPGPHSAPFINLYKRNDMETPAAGDLWTVTLSALQNGTRLFCINYNIPPGFNPTALSIDATGVVRIPGSLQVGG